MLQGLTEERSRAVDDILLSLLVRAEAEAVYLCERSGAILARTAVRDYANDENIAALAAGSFYATRELSRLIGQPEFTYVFHEGEKKSVYMQNTQGDLLLLVLFGKQSNPGLVRLFSDESCARLDEALPDLTPEQMQSELNDAGIAINEQGQLFRKAAPSGP